MAGKINCGTVNVNEGFAATFGSIDAPMGGMKNSGLGRRQGRDGIRRFVEVQSIGTQSGIPIAPSHGLGRQVLHVGDDRLDAGDETQRVGRSRPAYSCPSRRVAIGHESPSTFR